jgi:Fur family peroxide stress response transcriptional regulator
MSSRFDHPTATDVYVSARKINSNISLGTVYRNLNEMVKAGKLLKITIPGGADRFDGRIVEHHHVYCRNCKKVFDISVDLSESLDDKIRNETGIDVDNIQLVGIGLCQVCKNINLINSKMGKERI